MQFPQNGRLTSYRSPRDERRPMNGFVSLETVDPSQFELALRPWELLARPKSADAFHHRVAMLCGPDFIVYREAFSSPMSVVGLSPSGLLGIGVPLSIGNGVEYWRQGHSSSSCPLSLPGPLHVTWDHPHEQIVALIDLESLRKSLAERAFEHLCRLARAHRADLPPANREALAIALNQTLKVCETRPALATSPKFLSDTYDKLVVFLSLIARASLRETTAPPGSIRTRGLHRAVEFLREHASINPSMAELCDASGTSERTLQYAFRDAFNMSPREFMFRRRLHSARRALLTCDPYSASVGEIAMDLGFFELGRFAAKYRDCFGELPSETLGGRT